MAKYLTFHTISDFPMTYLFSFVFFFHLIYSKYDCSPNDVCFQKEINLNGTFKVPVTKVSCCTFDACNKKQNNSYNYLNTRTIYFNLFKLEIFLFIFFKFNKLFY